MEQAQTAMVHMQVITTPSSAIVLLLYCRRCQITQAAETVRSATDADIVEKEKRTSYIGCKILRL